LNNFLFHFALQIGHERYTSNSLNTVRRIFHRGIHFHGVLNGPPVHLHWGVHLRRHTDVTCRSCIAHGSAFSDNGGTHGSFPRIVLAPTGITTSDNR